jgi:anti-sigma regulatory factor (Ser/Thr protein kinase)
MRPAPEFRHTALFYRSTEEYLTAALAHLYPALDAGEPIMVAAPAGNLGLLRHAVGDAAGARIQFVDLAVVGRNPAQIIPALLAFTAAHAGKRATIIGEATWPGRSEAEMSACAIHEALFNVAFADQDATVLCPYDLAVTSAASMADVRRSHPYVVDAGAVLLCADYAPEQVIVEHHRPPAAPPVHAERLVVDSPHMLAPLRRLIEKVAATVDLPRVRAQDIAVAATELASNALDHATGTARCHVWVDDTGIICQVDDDGHLTDPLAGRLPVPPGAIRGRGLLLINTLCDLVQTYTVPGRLTTRISVRR